jgi:hypothetical protein
LHLLLSRFIGQFRPLERGIDSTKADRLSLIAAHRELADLSIARRAAIATSRSEHEFLDYWYFGHSFQRTGCGAGGVGRRVHARPAQQRRGYPDIRPTRSGPGTPIHLSHAPTGHQQQRG